MTTAPTQRQAELAGQIVVVTDGSADIGLEMARRARAVAGLGGLGSAALVAAGPAALERFSGNRPDQIGHVMVAAVGPAVH